MGERNSRTTIPFGWTTKGCSATRRTKNLNRLGFAQRHDHPYWSAKSVSKTARKFQFVEIESAGGVGKPRMAKSSRVGSACRLLSRPRRLHIFAAFVAHAAVGARKGHEWFNFL